jgi:aryl-alcohol dehydrogenase-like predicted oxidoreductase
MVGSRDGSIPHRRVGPDSFSQLAVTVVPPPLPGSSRERAVVERLRRARAAGVTVFDVGGGPGLSRAERLLVEAFPRPDPDLIVLLGRSPNDLVEGHGVERRSVPPGETIEGRLRHSLEESNGRLAPHRAAIVEWTTGPPERGGTDVPLPSLTELVPGTRICRRVSSPDEVARAAKETTDGPVLLSGVLSLLDGGLVPPLEALARDRLVAFLARDPFADGLLDGTRNETLTVARGPGVGPVRLRDLQSEFDPVLRLGFLTAAHHRTLGQAAVRYAAHWPWVACVVVPLPSAERLDEVLRTFATPDLTEEEVGRVRRSAGVGPARSGGPSGFPQIR